MIGQQDVITKLKTTKAKSVLLLGPAHYGKKTLLRELFRNDESVYEITGNAAAFRDCLERIYQTVRPTVYLIPDLHKANATIQNILLKVLEEPPKAARFFLTASGTILPTITSRCVTYHINPYSGVELNQLEAPLFLKGKYRSPGELKLLNFEGCDKLFQMLETIKVKMTGATLANILKDVKEFNKCFKELLATQEVFILMVRNIFGECKSYDWLRSQPDDAVQYVRCYFFIRLWLELSGG